MEPLLEWLSQHADSAHFLIFGLLMLAGFSLPVSEELMLVASGVLASTVIPDHTIHLFIATFLGCYFSDWIAYWLGRLFGEKLFQLKWVPFSLNESRLQRIENFYKKYGFLALLIGRFIPFGVRNGIFMTAGISKIHFGRFVLMDGIGCFIFSMILFSIAYCCGKNYETTYDMICQGGMTLFVVFVLFAVGSFAYIRLKKKPTTETI